MTIDNGMPYIKMMEGHYGALALKRTIGPNMLKGLVISFVIHTLIVSAPYIIELFKSEEEIPPPPIRVVDISQLTKLTSHQQAQEQVQIAVPKMAAPKASIPIAVSIDEVEVDLDQSLMPSQKDILTQLSNTGGDEVGLGLGSNEVIEIREEVKDPDEIPEPSKFVPMEVAPQPLPDFSPAPKYPKLAQTTGIKGRVVVQCYVDKTGTVKKYIIKSVTPPGLGFEEEVGKVISDWKFTPAIQNGKPLGVWIEMPFTFAVE